MNAQARTTDPWTSHAAAATVNRERSHALVLAVFKSGNVYEDRDLVRILAGRCSDSRIRGARKELMDAGEIEACGFVGPEGRPRRVFRLVRKQGELF